MLHNTLPLAAARQQKLCLRSQDVGRILICYINMACYTLNSEQLNNGLPGCPASHINWLTLTEAAS